MKIAVVDDNESERTKLCTLLREWGEKRKYEMVCNEFTDGEDFLKASGTYQAVFLDIYMEKLNGIDTARIAAKRIISSRQTGQGYQRYAAADK